jgi:hypothetical protein
LRFIRAVRHTSWAELASGREEEIQRAAANLVERDGSCSVFECASQADSDLIAVALSASRMRQPFHHVEIEEEDLAAAGVRRLKTPGQTCLAAANALHWDLALDDELALGLVRVLAARSIEVRTIRPGSLRTLAERLRQAGHPIPPGSWLVR